MSTETIEALLRTIVPEAREAGYWNEGILSFKISNATAVLKANSYYFGHPDWARNYFEVVHRDRAFQDRWLAVMGSWHDQVVVDIGCGPGNVYAALRDRCGIPRLMLGVDVSQGGLKMAQELGYVPVLADAHQLPFVSGFADLVILNATLHHCEQMTQVLQEAARLVRPGGVLILDHDPQKQMWGNNIVAKLIWNLRLPIYRLLRRGGHTTSDEQMWSTATEAHHKPGDGVSSDFFHQVLQPLGFTVQLYPHNRTVGAEILQGERGRAEWRIRWSQWLSGVNPDTAEGALVLMCVATRSNPA